jgi:hypothetical protein
MLATAIYFAQRSYKATYQQMTYGQGVKVGFWATFFVALWTSLLVYGVIAWRRKEIIPRFLEWKEITLQTTPLLQESPAGLASLYEYLSFMLAVFISTLTIGSLVSLVLGWFSRRKNNRRP